jgi:deoxyhypusine synthase
MSAAVPAEASAAVLQPSEPVSDSAISVQGPDFEKKPSLQELLKSYERIGFQASSLGRAIEIVNRMVCVLG